MSTLRFAAMILVGVGCLGLFIPSLPIAPAIKWANALALIALIADIYVTPKTTKIR